MASRRRKTRSTSTSTALARVPAPRSGTQQIVIRPPPSAPLARRSPPRRRRAPSGGSGRGGGMLGLPADTTAAVAAGGVVGLLKGSGLLEKLPRLPFVGRLGSAAILAGLYARHSGSRLAGDVSRALATLAAYQLASSDKPLAERIDGGMDEVGAEDFPTG